MSVELYNEVSANLSWLQVNSEYKDPVYQNTLKLQLELYSKLFVSNYTLHDDCVVSSNLEIPRYGSYQCTAVTGKTAYLDSAFSCLLFQLPFFLEYIQLGWIGFVFVLPIILISIFGGIKESYRWFILNQAIWDAFICYDFICARPTLLGWSGPVGYLKENTCFYRQRSSADFLFFAFQGFRSFLRNASFIPIFHLAFSRFLAMYFPTFYKKFTKNGYKICIFLILYNVICIAIFSTPTISLMSSSMTSTTNTEDCYASFCPSRNFTYCKQNVPKYFQCYNRILVNLANAQNEQKKVTQILKYISLSLPPIMFFLSIIFAGFLIYKITSQLQFQLKTNQDSFKQTIKISTVVAFQCLTMSVIFVITGIQKFLQIKSEAGGGPVGTYRMYDYLPTWLLLLQYYTTTASLNIIRILLDSCIILTVLSGYSKYVVLTFKFLWLCLSNPKEAFKKVRYTINGSQVTNISASNK